MAEESVLEAAASKDDGPGMSRSRAFAWGIGIFLYFAVMSVWLVSYAIEDLFADFDDAVADVLALGLWAGVMGGGIWGLRKAQERGYFK